MGATKSVAHVAQQVGYKSKKNFYRAFTRLIGTTPAAFHRLAPVRRLEIVESTRSWLTARR
jgi:AraC-like DNA-binding protein